MTYHRDLISQEKARAQASAASPVVPAQADPAQTLQQRLAHFIDGPGAADGFRSWRESLRAKAAGEVALGVVAAMEKVRPIAGKGGA